MTIKWTNPHNTIGYYAHDPQDVAPAFYDDEGAEVYPGETYWVADDGGTYSETSWSKLQSVLRECGVEIEGRQRTAYDPYR